MIRLLRSRNPNTSALRADTSQSTCSYDTVRHGEQKQCPHRSITSEPHFVGDSAVKPAKSISSNSRKSSGTYTRCMNDTCDDDSQPILHPSSPSSSSKTSSSVPVLPPPKNSNRTAVNFSRPSITCLKCATRCKGCEDCRCKHCESVRRISRDSKTEIYPSSSAIPSAARCYTCSHHDCQDEIQGCHLCRQKCTKQYGCFCQQCSKCSGGKDCLCLRCIQCTGKEECTCPSCHLCPECPMCNTTTLGGGGEDEGNNGKRLICEYCSVQRISLISMVTINVVSAVFFTAVLLGAMQPWKFAPRVPHRTLGIVLSVLCGLIWINAAAWNLCGAISWMRGYHDEPPNWALVRPRWLTKIFGGTCMVTQETSGQGTPQTRRMKWNSLWRWCCLTATKTKDCGILEQHNEVDVRTRDIVHLHLDHSDVQGGGTDNKIASFLKFHRPAETPDEEKADIAVSSSNSKPRGSNELACHVPASAQKGFHVERDGIEDYQGILENGRGKLVAQRSKGLCYCCIFWRVYILLTLSMGIAWLVVGIYWELYLVCLEVGRRFPGFSKTSPFNLVEIEPFGH